jgi:hypothetical protein
VAPDDAQRPLKQFPEQQSPFPAQLLPKVPHPPVTMAAHTAFAQLLEQQSVPAAHFPPFATHRAAPHFPPAHTFVQHSVGCVHDAPAPWQDGPATPQIREVGSHTPEQHPAPFAHASPGAPQLTAPEPPAPCEPADPVPGPPLPAAPLPLPPAAAPPSLLRADDDEFPHPLAASTSDAATDTTTMLNERGVMSLGARRSRRRLRAERSRARREPNARKNAPFAAIAGMPVIQADRDILAPQIARDRFDYAERRRASSGPSRRVSASTGAKRAR